MTADSATDASPAVPNFGLIIAGGSGTRLWPLSRSEAPKQLHPLGDSERSLLQETFARLARSIPPDRIKVVTSRKYAAQVLRHVRELAPDFPGENVLGEPRGRDSGPAILWGVQAVAREQTDATVTIVWCDQHIARADAFDEALAKASRLAATGELVVIGVEPHRPETGLGYIQFGEQAGPGVFKVAQFMEKPDRATAEKFLADGGYVWNAGLFVFHVATLLEEFGRLAPAYLEAFREGGFGGGNNGPVTPEQIEAIYDALKPDSIDYMLLEKTGRLLVVPADLGWSDLGAWDVLYREAPKDAEGNAIQGNVITLGTRNSLIRAERRLVAAVGVENLIVVDTDDALLICDMSKTQQVKQLVEKLQAEKREEAAVPTRVERPWGSFTVLREGPGFKLKMIEVMPGEKLSLQMHHRRAEHWIVIEGQGEMTCGEETVVRGPNESFHIPQGHKHCVGNPGATPLRFIEVQYGDYLGEDDIVRFEDRYGRV